MLDQIKTVQDLINLNNTEPDPSEVHQNNIQEDLVASILEEEPKVGLAIVKQILVALEDFHIGAIDVIKKEGNIDHIAKWAYDASKLTSAYELISDIDL